LNRRQEEFEWRAGRIEQERHAGRGRRNLLQQFHPFAAQRGIINREAGDIAARMREACGETAADGIGDGDKHDRSCRHLAGKRSDHWRRLTEHHVGPQPGQLFGQPVDPFDIRARPAKLDADIAAFYPAKIRERTPERRDH
jgi:hypothetical protein